MRVKIFFKYHVYYFLFFLVLDSNATYTIEWEFKLSEYHSYYWVRVENWSKVIWIPLILLSENWNTMYETVWILLLVLSKGFNQTWDYLNTTYIIKWEMKFNPSLFEYHLYYWVRVETRCMRLFEYHSQSWVRVWNQTWDYWNTTYIIEWEPKQNMRLFEYHSYYWVRDEI